MKPLQLPMFTPESEWRPPSIADLPSWEGAGRVAIDCETCDPKLKELGPGPRRPGSFVCGYSFAIEHGPSFYVPVAHEGGDNVENPEAAWEYLRQQARVFTGEIVGANLSYDLDWLANYGVWFSACKAFRDIQVADPLIYELHRSYSLQNIAERYDLTGKNEHLMKTAAMAYGVGAKDGMWRLPARYVGAYAIQDVELPLKVLRRQEKIIEEQGLERIWNLESKVLPVLVKMRRRGVRIDQSRLHAIEDWSREQEREALAKVRHMTGHEINVGDVWRAEALAPALDYIGLPVERTATGKISIRKDLLENARHEVASAILWARKVNKLRTTFASSIWTHMTNGRIHCTFNQIAVEDEDGIKGARYGRLSSSNPNMQQQPSRDEFASRWRSIYVPDTDLWACLDYSQQEPRWVTHYAEVMRLNKASAAAEKYRTDPSTDNHDMMTRIVYGDEAVDAMDKDQFKIARTACKIIYLGLCYGEGGAKLCRDLGLPTRWAISSERTMHFFATQHEAMQNARNFKNPRIFETAGEEGQAILDKFNGNAPFIKKLAGKAADKAKQEGFIVTIGGRRCRFPTDAAGNYDWTHKSLNRLIQGSSADQMKTAMVKLDEAGFDLQLQVHDEVDTSVESREQAEAMAQIMREAIPSNVPFKVDIEIGPSWGEIK